MPRRQPARPPRSAQKYALTCPRDGRFHPSRVTTDRSSWPLLRHRLLPKAEIGECMLAVVVDEDLRHLAVAHVNHLRLLCRQRVQLQPAGLAAPAGAEKHQHAFGVELTVLLHTAPVAVPRAQDV